MRIAELGVILSYVPNGISVPKPFEVSEGFEAQLPLGGTTKLSIARYEDPLRASRSVLDTAYQQELVSETKSRGVRVSDAQLTKIGGQDAWIVAGSRSGAGGRVGFYEVVATLVENRQLVRISASAMGLPDKPKEFETAIRVLEGITFAPVDLSAVPVPASAAASPETVPKFLEGPNARLYYPDKAIARGHQGIIDLSFSIDKRGHVQNIVEDYAQYPELAENPIAFLADGRFKIPGDWIETGAQNKRFTMEFQYVMSAPGHYSKGCEEKAPRVEHAQVVAVCHSSSPLH
jgi:hypothetical protein